MINKVIVNNFKKFEHLEFELADHLVIAGPNNSGKTTLLQSIAAWSELAFQWSNNNPDLVRERDGNYPSTSLNLLKFSSVPLADFDHLWTSKNVEHPASLCLHTDQWSIGFEILYKEQEFAAIRPTKKVNEDDLEQYIRKPLTSIYVPPLSGLDTKEKFFDTVVIPAQLARAQAGSVLRNLLLFVSQDVQKWQTLQKVVRSFFDYELDYPSGAAEILARYRHSDQSPSYDLSSAASGFLQVLLVHAALLYKEASVVLIDEPDAHLHILLQDKMYHNLREHARQNGSQLIIATHSERLIDAAEQDDLRLLAGELRKVNNKQKLPETLYLENTEIMLAETEPGILYIEGPTDIPILKAWARIWEHPLLLFLEKPFEWETAEKEWSAVRHFSAMRLVVPNFCGVELCDGDNKDHSHTSTLPEGMKRLYWNRYEIESYLIYPQAIARFVESIGGQQAADKAVAYMERQLPPALYENPFELSDYLQGTKGKNVLANILNAAGLDVKETDYYQIAAQMTKEEIHPEVIEKLDAIVEQFNYLDTTP